jgi:hypothetical protein
MLRKCVGKVRSFVVELSLVLGIEWQQHSLSLTKCDLCDLSASQGPVV